jgi:hypothetical protein
MALKKMVIIRMDVGMQWQEMPGADAIGGGAKAGRPTGGDNIPVLRLFVENRRITGQVLRSAPLPPGHEAEARNYYNGLLAYYLSTHIDPDGMSSDTLRAFQAAAGPEADPEEWLTLLNQAHSRASAYREFEESAYPPA